MPQIIDEAPELELKCVSVSQGRGHVADDNFSAALSRSGGAPRRFMSFPVLQSTGSISFFDTSVRCIWGCHGLRVGFDPDRHHDDGESKAGSGDLACVLLGRSDSLLRSLFPSPDYIPVVQPCRVNLHHRNLFPEELEIIVKSLQ